MWGCKCWSDGINTNLINNCYLKMWWFVSVVIPASYIAVELAFKL
jgi:hypothetical protein